MGRHGSESGTFWAGKFSKPRGGLPHPEQKKMTRTGSKMFDPDPSLVMHVSEEIDKRYE